MERFLPCRKPLHNCGGSEPRVSGHERISSHSILNFCPRARRKPDRRQPSRIVRLLPPKRSRSRGLSSEPCILLLQEDVFVFPNSRCMAEPLYGPDRKTVGTDFSIPPLRFLAWMPIVGH